MISEIKCYNSMMLQIQYFCIISASFDPPTETCIVNPDRGTIQGLVPFK